MVVASAAACVWRNGIGVNRRETRGVAWRGVAGVAWRRARGVIDDNGGIGERDGDAS